MGRVEIAPSVGSWWADDVRLVFAAVESGPTGLTGGEALRRLRTSPPSVGRQMSSDVELVVRQFRSPILLLLMFAAALSQLLGENVDAAIIAVIVVGSGVLGFFQERGAVHAVHSLMTSVQIHCRVWRDGSPGEVAVRDVVRGDVIDLRAGDVVPGDGVVIATNDLRVDESALTGEAYPRHKRPGVVDAKTALVDRMNSVHFGTHVVSGEGRVVVVATGSETEFGRVASHVAARHVPTSFEQGVTRFGLLLLRWTAVLVVSVFVVNLVLHRPVVDSLLFSLALSVGLTPQMLPAIVTLSLSRGATELARRRVIVKRLEAIEDIGGIDVLCTDKTGTLTVGAVALDASLDPSGSVDAEVSRLAWLNARHQTGYPNPVDDAVLSSVSVSDLWDVGRRVAEIPYDFERKRLSVIVSSSHGVALITKGAVEKVFEVCSTVRGHPIEAELDRLRGVVSELSSRGLRVLGVASRTVSDEPIDDDDAEDRDAGRLDSNTSFDESGLDFAGFLTFFDPPKPGAKEAITRLAGLNVSTRLVTGDHRLAAAHIADLMGIPHDPILTGADVAWMTDPDLEARVGSVSVYAEVTPIDKERIVRAFSRSGHSVAFLGDGINDAPAIHVADVGISVDSAVDVAKESADVVLLDKELTVIGDGVEAGRRIFANTLKYVYVTTSANFGNMLSMAAASMFLPFLPLLPAQILLLNFLSDLPGTTIATDRVDPEQLRTSRRWNIGAVRSFMIVFGITSAVFDFTTFAVLRLGVHADPTDFRSGWFVESTITELAAMLVLRTARPFHRSRPSGALFLSSALVLVVTVVIPYSPLASPLGLDEPRPAILLVLAAVTGAYVGATEFAKRRFPRLLEAYG